jgi:hypothetical protein
MQVILERTDFYAWLNDGGTAMLKPAANDILQRWPGSKRQQPRAPIDDPTLVEPISAVQARDECFAVARTCAARHQRKQAQSYCHDATAQQRA